MCLIYIDDVIVSSNTVMDHIRHVDDILALLRNARISLKLKKCFFFQPRVDYLGHVVESGRLSVAEKVKEALATFTFPKSLTQVRSLFGACNVY